MNLNPEVSVIIVNFNGKKWLKDCLSSLKDQNYKNYEVILVDNASKDGSIELVKKDFPFVKLIQNHENSGFAGGNNLGFRNSRGQLIILLNNDTRVGKTYIKDFVESLSSHPKAGIVQSKILFMDKNLIDSCGSYWTDTSFLYYVGNSKDPNNKLYDKPFREFSVKGASMLIKREVIEKIGLFDETFWNYYEETDLCQRAWIAGYEVWYDPKAVCYHAMGGTSLTFTNDFIQFHNFKNKMRSFIKNFSLPYLYFYLFAYLIFNLLIAFVWIIRGKYKHSLSLVKANIWNIQNLTSTLEKRKEIQKLRKTADSEYLKTVRKNPGPSYYIYLLNDKLDQYEDQL